MKTIKVTIEGTTPLLMNKFNVQAMMDKSKGKRITKEYDPKIEAEAAAYFSTDKKSLIIPSNVLYAAILNAATWYKFQKRSAKQVIAGSLRVTPEEVSLGTKSYEIDNRAVVIMKARVIKSRPIIKKWKVSFELVYNEKVITQPELLKPIVEEAGQRIGLMDYRPQKGGPYGTFKVTKWED